MAEITVTSDQADMISQSPGNVAVKDPRGKIVGYISRDFTAEEVAAVLKRLKENQRVYTTQEVLAHLRSLEAR